jgi:hypothetical protein
MAMGKMMKKTLVAILFFLALLLAIHVAGSATTAFAPVKVRTKVLTMTGVKEAPVPEAPRDYVFAPIEVRTKTLTMTGMKE